MTSSQTFRSVLELAAWQMSCSNLMSCQRIQQRSIVSLKHPLSNMWRGEIQDYCVCVSVSVLHQ